MLNMKDLKTLAKVTANAKPSVSTAYSWGEEKFSYAQLNDTFVKELNELAGTYSLFRQNKNEIYSLIEETIDEVLPKRVMENYGQFAEIKTFAQGDKPVFKNRITAAARRRAKQFITHVGLAGRYEVFKLDGANYEVPMGAVGGAAQIGLEEMLDGRITLADVLDIVMEGIDEAIYQEIAKALVGMVDSLGTQNFVEANGFDEASMDHLIAVADVYGKANIYCTYEFAATMIPADARFSDSMKDQLWSNGYIGNYKGRQIIVLPQSFTDETNSTKVIDPAYAWIIPTGAEKVVKVAFEGETHVRDVENEDWSREVQVYKKMGVATIASNNICVYKNTALTTEVKKPTID